MHDANKILIGLVIFFGLITLPIWYNVASGKADYIPEPEIITDAKHCVEPTPYMRDKHMELLNTWKESVVRDGARTYTAMDGQEYKMSLTGTCLDCHSNKAEFCDRCHSYTGVKPYCWDCHVVPEKD